MAAVEAAKMFRQSRALVTDESRVARPLLFESISRTSLRSTERPRSGGGANDPWDHPSDYKQEYGTAPHPVPHRSGRCQKSNLPKKKLNKG